TQICGPQISRVASIRLFLPISRAGCAEFLGCSQCPSHRACPFSNDESAGPLLVDRPNAPKGPDAEVWMNFVSPGYFETMREPMLAGRNFDSTDTATSAPVEIVNEAFARKFLPGMNVIGTVVQRVEGRAGVTNTPVRIV